MHVLSDLPSHTYIVSIMIRGGKSREKEREKAERDRSRERHSSRKESDRSKRKEGERKIYNYAILVLSRVNHSAKCRVSGRVEMQM